MVSFRNKLASGLNACKVEVCDHLQDTPYQAILVIGGTRDLAGLWRARRRGVPVVQRLDGMNWMHRLPGGVTPGGIRGGRLRHFLRAEYGNLNLRVIRSRLASRLVYQSQFVRRWWENKLGTVSAPYTVIYNGVDLSVYTPVGAGAPPDDRWRILMVEGSLMGGYEQGLQVAVEFVERLAERLRSNSGKSDSPGSVQKPGRSVELMIVGRVASALQRHWEEHLSRRADSLPTSLNWVGLVSQERIPKIDRSAHLLYSADVNAACPNSVIEALACGLPVVAFDTGALPELVTGDAGRVVPYGGDPWRLERPDIDALADAAGQILNDLEKYHRAARARAEAVFDLDVMVKAYLDILLGH